MRVAWVETVITSSSFERPLLLFVPPGEIGGDAEATAQQRIAAARPGLLGPGVERIRVRIAADQLLLNLALLVRRQADQRLRRRALGRHAGARIAGAERRPEPLGPLAIAFCASQRLAALTLCSATQCL